jgi:hypothetical protein
MKISSKCLHIVLQHNVTINDSISATLEHIAFVTRNEQGEKEIDLDFTDISNVTFMGMPVDDYKKFKTTMKELGINIDALFDEKARSLITPELKDELLYITL